MDSMPFEGWIWEFVRRSAAYRTKFNEFEKKIDSFFTNATIVKVLSNNNATRNDHAKYKKELNLIYGFMEQVEEELGVGDEAFMTSDPGLKNINRFLFKHYCFMIRPFCFRVPKAKLSQDEVERLAKLEKMNVFARGLPRPEIRYCDFKKSLYPPISGELVRCFTFEQLKRETDSHPVFGRAYSSPLELLYISKKRPEDTIFLGVSRTANISDVEKSLIPKLKELLRPNRGRVRTDKWKFYLIVYDLKARGLTFTEIAGEIDKLTQTEDLTSQNLIVDIRSIENYYKNALALINGGYKKYLKTAK